MLFTKPLSVEPVRFYPEPDYPKAEKFDGLPLGAEENLLWRIRHPLVASALFAAFSGLGCKGGPMESESKAPGPQPPPPAAARAGLLDKEYDPKQTYSNPFTWEASELPMEWNCYGTGLPSRLSEESVRRAVEKIFAEAGLALERDVSFKHEGVEGALDGYDAEKHVGYEFLQWQDTEDPTGYPKKDGERGSDFRRMFSHDEIKAIMELERKGKEHVAVISYQDSRFSYHALYDREASERIGKIKDREQRHKAWRELEAKQAKATLKRLEENLKQYLLWLRSQGAM